MQDHPVPEREISSGEFFRWLQKGKIKFPELLGKKSTDGSGHISPEPCRDISRYIFSEVPQRRREAGEMFMRQRGSE